MNTTTSKILKKSNPKVELFVDTIGNESETITIETAVVTKKNERMWLRKSKDTFKGELRKGSESPEPFHGKEAERLWLQYVGESE